MLTGTDGTQSERSVGSRTAVRIGFAIGRARGEIMGKITCRHFGREYSVSYWELNIALNGGL